MSFTVTKLRWLAEREPEHAARVARVMLPHDWLTWRLAGGGPGQGPRQGLRQGPGQGNPSVEPVTDRGDASGTGYFSPVDSRWLPDYAARALGHPVGLPRVAARARSSAGPTWGAAISAGTGDNIGAALGMSLAEGDVAVSIGTSGTAYAVTSALTADPSGLVSGFADATGRFLPLACTLNAARVLDVTARMLGVDAAGLSDLALKASPGETGLCSSPTWTASGHRTGRRRTGCCAGSPPSNTTPGEPGARGRRGGPVLARGRHRLPAAVGITPRRCLTGGAAKSEAVRTIAPAVFALPVVVPEAAEYVALGGARRAAWALSGTAEPRPGLPGRR